MTLQLNAKVRGIADYDGLYGVVISDQALDGAYQVSWFGRHREWVNEFFLVLDQHGAERCSSCLSVGRRTNPTTVVCDSDDCGVLVFYSTEG